METLYLDCETGDGTWLQLHKAASPNDNHLCQLDLTQNTEGFSINLTAETAERLRDRLSELIALAPPAQPKPAIKLLNVLSTADGVVDCGDGWYGVRFNGRICSPTWTQPGPADVYYQSLVAGTRQPEFHNQFS